MKKFLMSVDTMFWVEAANEEEAYDKALQSMPLSDLEFVVMEEHPAEEVN